MRPSFGQVEDNLDRAAQVIRAAPPFDILVLPELFSTGYLFRDRAELASLAEPPEGRTTAFLSDLARECGAWLCGGFPELDGSRIYNAAILVGPDETTFVYRKIHLFDRETMLFDPGNRPPKAWTLSCEHGTVRVGVMICFDWLFPEVARCLMLDGAEVLLHPANLVLPHCQEAMRTRSLENRVGSVTANRTGADCLDGEELVFTGQSQITDNLGEVLYRADESGQTVHVASLDLMAAREGRVTLRNRLRDDRRPHLYERLTAPSARRSDARN
jgi:predicted amidohydrolase